MPSVLFLTLFINDISHCFFNNIMHIVLAKVMLILLASTKNNTLGVLINYTFPIFKGKARKDKHIILY